MSSTRNIQREIKAKELSSVSESAIDFDNAEALIKALDFSHGLADEKLIPFRSMVVAKLNFILARYQQHLPVQNNTLNVISLGCGMPDDFLALTLLLKKHNPSRQLNYVGVDADAELIKQMTTEYRHFPNVKLLSADASDLLGLKNQIATANVLPDQGFDFILLRHPEITSTQGVNFEKMLQWTIPFLAHKKTTVFVSVYQFIEAEMVRACFNTDIYRLPAEYEYQLQGLVSRENFSGHMLEPECMSYIFKCEGLPVNAQDITAADKVFQAIKNTDIHPSHKIALLRMVNNQNFQYVLHFATAMCQLNILQILNIHKSELGNDFIRQAGLNMPQLMENITQSSVSTQNKLEMLDVLEEILKNAVLNADTSLRSRAR